MALVAIGFGQVTPLITSAYTRDADGNGILDRIDVHYNRIVTFAKGFDAAQRITIYSQTGQWQQFKVDSVAGTAAHDVVDSVATVFFQSMETAIPWSDMLFLISITGPENMSSVSGKLTIDAAGPVILQAVKQIYSVSDRTHDIVVIEFSEPVQTLGSSLFSLATKPGLVFDVWKRIGNVFVSQDSMLAGIPSFYGISSDSTQVAFLMTNGHDLTTDCFLSLKTAPSAITDKAVGLNPPPGNNQKVSLQVVVAASADAPVTAPGTGIPVSVMFRTSCAIPQVFVQTAGNSKNTVVKIVLFSLDGKVLFNTQTLTDTWISLPSKTKGFQIIAVESGGKTILTKAGLF